MPSDAGGGGGLGCIVVGGLDQKPVLFFFKAHTAVHMFKRKRESTDFACKGYLQ